MYEYNCRASKFQRVSSKYAAGSRFVKKTISTTANPIVSTAASSQGNIYKDPPSSLQSPLSKIQTKPLYISTEGPATHF